MGTSNFKNPGAALPFEIPEQNSLLAPEEFQMGSTCKGLNFYHRDTDPSGGPFETARKSGQKKSGLNGSSAGIIFVPGLFSEFFNVAASRPAQMTTERHKISPLAPQRQGEAVVNRPLGPALRDAPLRRDWAWERTEARFRQV